MNKLIYRASIVLFILLTMFSCQSIKMAEFFGTKTYINSENEKIFSFGNEFGKNVLVIIGMDRYNESINGKIDQIYQIPLENKIENFFNAEILYSDTSSFDSCIKYKWKQENLTSKNARFFVIITNNNRSIFDVIIDYSKKNHIKFDYLLLDFHGSPDRINGNCGTNWISRADMIQEFNRIEEIKSCFNKKSSGISIGCSTFSDEVIFPFAIFMKTITGIDNFYASKSKTMLSLGVPGFEYRAAAQFNKVGENRSKELLSVYSYYKKYVTTNSMEINNNLRFYNLTIEIPSEVLSEKVDNKKNYNRLDRTNILNEMKSGEFKEFFKFFIEIHASDQFIIHII